MTNTPQELLRATVRRFGRGMAFAAVLSVFLSLLHLTVPLYMIQLYDRVLSSRSIDTLLALTVVAGGALVVLAVLDYVRARAFLIIGESIALRLNIPTLQAAMSDALRRQSSNAQQAIRDLNDLRMFVSGSAIAVPVDLMMTPLFLAVLFLMHPLYGFIAMGAGAILVLFGLAVELMTRQPLSQANDAAARSFSEIGSAVRHAEVIEAMGMLNALARRWRHGQRRMVELLHQGNNRGKAITAASKSSRMAMQLSVLATGVVLVIRGEVSPGTMIAAAIIVGRMLHPFEQLIEGWRQWVFAHSAYRRIRGLIQETGTGRQTIALPRAEGRLVVDHLSFIPPGSDKPVLRGVSFTLEPGEALGVIGPSGAGKSTLARMLVGLWPPTTGGVYLDGHNVYQWERESFGRSVGYVPQGVALLEGTVRENIARMTEAEPREVVAAARKADVHEMIGRLPNGYDTQIGDSGFGLSGGQRQRIALARALFGAPRLLVLDEPNSNMDHAGELALLKTVAEAKRSGAMVVLIAHRPSIISAVDKLLVLKDGAMDQFGPRTDVIKAVTPALPDDQAARGPSGVTRLTKP